MSRAQASRPPEQGARLTLGADARATVALVAVVLAFFGSYVLLGLTFFEDDLKDYHWPILVYLGQALRAGALPLWSPTMAAGYPFLADGTAGALYPLNWLAAIVPADWVVMCLLALRTVASGLFLYAFARAIGLSPLAAWLAGMAYAFSGFSVGHWIHLNISHTTLTLPLALLGVEKAWRSTGRAAWLWLLLAGLAQGLQWLAAHPQAALISAMGLFAYAAYRALWPGRPMARLRRLARLGLGTAVVAVISAGLSAAQIVPMLELATLSSRAAGIPYAEASLFSLPPHNLLTAFWPLVFLSGDRIDWGLSVRWEVAFYVGQLPLLLGVVAVLGRRDRHVLFWAGLTLIGLWLALAHYAPLNLHWWLYQLPGFSLFRVPGRFLLLTDLGLAILAGYGLDLLLSRAQNPKRGCGVVLQLVVALLVLTAAGWAVVLWLNSGSASLTYALRAGYFSWPHSSSWPEEEALRGARQSLALASPRLLVPSALALVGAAVLLAWHRRPTSYLWPVALCGVVALDLFSFTAQFWQAAPPLEALPGTRSTAAQFLSRRGEVARVLSVPKSVTFANQLLGSDLSEVNLYSQLVPQRFREYVGLAADGDNRLLDLLGVEWVALPPGTRQPLSMHGVPFAKEKPALPVSKRNDAFPASYDMLLPWPQRTQSVRLVGGLLFGAHAAQGDTVAEIVLSDEEGRQVVLPVLAGVHIAEVAAERSDVRPQLQHSPVQVAHREETVDGAGRPYANLLYFGEIAVPGGALTVTRVTLRVVNPNVDVYIYGLGLVDDEGAVLALDRYMSGRFRERFRDESGRLVENTAALPRVHLVGEARSLPAVDSPLATMADQLVDPTSVVYLEGDIDLALYSEPGPAGSAQITASEDNRLAVAVEAERPALLVVADLYYPGWQAKVDGREAPIYCADFVFRAVPVPAGRHEVVFTFAPTSVWLGFIITGLTVLALLAATLFLVLSARRARPSAGDGLPTGGRSLPNDN